MATIFSTAKSLMTEDNFEEAKSFIEKVNSYYKEIDGNMFRVYAVQDEFVMISIICEDITVIEYDDPFIGLCGICDKVEFAEGGGEAVGDSMAIGFTLKLQGNVNE